ncbi:phage/plasmid replication domain-containing protein [Aeromonas sp. HMWF014]|uniref:phage/plasmid replication domain-containing protein n=1 Tax=Aeromonas sp. HMWF014 TaxID=2056850 RepID=UPI000D3B748F|nr:phage/plasmid replication protein [Aeromonas sp. HMWF014]PTT55532.1 Replication-associated protein G2P [Aeromonas sp. HMWF014]
MFFDWLTIEQDFGFQLPLLDGGAYARVVIEEGEIVETGSLCAPAFSHKGSFCDSVLIKVNGSSVRMSGNPSRWGRLDNLWGHRSVDACVAVYNSILRDIYGHCDQIPQFTKCTKVFYAQGSACEHIGADGAILRELHVTENISVGAGNERDYISGLSTLRYRHSIPRLHTDGNSVDWLSKLGNAALIYPTVYNKAYELELHSLGKIARNFGDDSDEMRHIQSLIGHCRSVGIVRFELKLKNRYLQRNNMQYWGLSDLSPLEPLMTEFTNIDQKLSVTSMDFETIAERLITLGIVDTTRAANTTSMYALQWMHGQNFDFSKTQIQTHRARLRKLGIDIATKCNISKFSPIFVTARREVKSNIATPPSWYVMPQTQLRAVA